MLPVTLNRIVFTIPFISNNYMFISLTHISIVLSSEQNPEECLDPDYSSGQAQRR